MIAWTVLCMQGLMVSQARKAAREASDYARTFYEDTDLQRYLQQRQASTAIPLRPDDPVRGNPAAPHTAVVFSDFQCPACRGFAETFEREVLPAMGDRLRIVYKHFPLEPECNSLVQQTIHEHACEAAEMAEAARSLGGSDAFWSMHDRLFRVQQSLGPGLWPSLAQEAGLDPARIAELMNSRAFRDRIREDTELGERLDVQSTPTVFLDGKKMEDWRRLDVWQALTK
jgi:protein-disulfide isomerase